MLGATHAVQGFSIAVRLHHEYVVQAARLSTVMDKLGRCDLAATQAYSMQLADAVLFLHQHGVTHRRITTDNIVVDVATGTVKLAGHSVSHVLHGLMDANSSTMALPDKMVRESVRCEWSGGGCMARAQAYGRGRV